MFHRNDDWESALAVVAERVASLIAEDSFSTDIYPDYLARSVECYPRRGGKRLRPAILLWSCGLAGGNPETALSAAVAVEIYHNWTLVHDDLIDRDDVRRGQPTVHAGVCADMSAARGLSTESAVLIGETTAILSGDLLHAWAVRKLCTLRQAGIPADCVLSLVERMQDMLGRGLISGEALDVDFSVREWGSLTTAEVLKMIEGKTSVLLQYAAEAGAVIAHQSVDTSHPDAIHAGAYARYLGLAFQLRDDWLGLFGNFALLGKPLGSDLIARKPTLLMTESMSRLSSLERAELLGLTGNKNLAADDLTKVRELVKNCGAEQIVAALANDYANKAINTLSFFPDSIYKTWLTSLARYAVTRHK